MNKFWGRLLITVLMLVFSMSTAFAAPAIVGVRTDVMSNFYRNMPTLEGINIVPAADAQYPDFPKPTAALFFEVKGTNDFYVLNAGTITPYTIVSRANGIITVKILEKDIHSYSGLGNPITRKWASFTIRPADLSGDSITVTPRWLQ
ncbi:MAG: hypothetical protein K0R22_92 [Sporomusa sp.]|jgi:hypothetical protein|nr:hypothetical protein [Sporomusa sp.]